MKITFDTNILVQDFWFDSPHSKVFFEELNIIPATLHVPEIVIDETVNKYKEFLNEKAAEQKRINAEVSRLLKKDLPDTLINIDQAGKDYEIFLKQKLQGVNAKIFHIQRLITKMLLNIF